MKYAAGIITAIVTALVLTMGLGTGLGLMPLMVIVGFGLMGYGITEKLLGKDRDNAR
jgi:hypothetical protein